LAENSPTGIVLVSSLEAGEILEWLTAKDTKDAKSGQTPLSAFFASSAGQNAAPKAFGLQSKSDLIRLNPTKIKSREAMGCSSEFALRETQAKTTDRHSSALIIPKMSADERRQGLQKRSFSFAFFAPFAVQKWPKCLSRAPE
jgi:hypothetical protein